jgi:hypothetical protein
MAGLFLKDMITRSTINKDVIARARCILEHYPTKYELNQISSLVPDFFSTEEEIYYD